MEIDTGRRNQKLRTRKALVDAANAFLARGQRPTLDAVAAAALVSRATAYRYFPSVDALLADAFFERVLVDEVSPAVADEPDPIRRALRAEEAVNDIVFANEVGVYVLTKLYAEQRLERGGRDETGRPSRRLTFIDEALAPVTDRLGPARTRRLRHALALAIGTEAVIALRDVCGLDPAEARDVTRWTVAALVRQALAEATEPAAAARRSPAEEPPSAAARSET